MSDDLRTTALSFTFNGQDALTGVRQITKALNDEDKSVDKLNSSLDKNSTVIKKNVKTKKELEAEARKIITQQKRAIRNVDKLNREYEHQAAIVNKTAKEQEVLNAVYRLGANATDKQRQEVAQLVNGYQRVREQTTKTQRGFRNLRGVTQNLGWQLQDVAVQVGTNTNLFTIFAQQGSQMASAFGPIGGLIGAGIAIGGTAMSVFQKTMKSAKVDVKEFEEVVKSLNTTMSDSKMFDIKLAGSFKDKTIEEVDKQLKGIEKANKNAKKLYQEARDDYDEVEQFYKNPSRTALDRADGGKFAMPMPISEVPEHQTKIFQKAMSDYAYLTEKNAIETQKLLKIKQLLEKSNGRSIEQTLKDEKSVAAMVKTLEEQVAALGKTKRMLAVLEAEKLNASDAEKIRINELHKSLEADELRIQKIKDEKKAIEDREAVRAKIKKGQESQIKKMDPRQAETDLFDANKAKLEAQQQYADSVAEANLLMEAEKQRHSGVMKQIDDAAVMSQMETYATVVGNMGNIFGRLANIAEEGSSQAKQLYYMNQTIAMAESIINGHLAAMKIRAALPVVGEGQAQWAQAQGYISAGIIAGQTISAYDKGGRIPSGGMGIVSEYGDELVNGQLIKGPARVTSREDTAKIMSGGAEITIINKIDGARYSGEVDSEGRLRIIAEQVFSSNLDSGVSRVLANRNSKATKSIKRNFNIKSRV